jgi:hypothetical protein
MASSTLVSKKTRAKQDYVLSDRLRPLTAAERARERTAKARAIKAELKAAAKAATLAARREERTRRREIMAALKAQETEQQRGNTALNTLKKRRMELAALMQPLPLSRHPRASRAVVHQLKRTGGWEDVMRVLSIRPSLSA